MLTQAQRNAVFTNIGTGYTIGGQAYTATIEYLETWSGVIDTPVIMLDYPTEAVLKKKAIGRGAEWDTSRLSVDVFANTDNANGVHGMKIAHEIARVLILWFKETADTALMANGLKIAATYPARSLSHLEEKVYRRHFEIDILYKLI